MYNIYIICISLRMRVHVCVRHLPTDCDRINRYLSSKITLHVSPPKTSNSPPSFVSFNGFNSPFGFFHQPNDARKRANYWPRDTCAISYGATFLPNVPSYPPPILGKENCPKIADRRAIAAMGKPSSFFLFFFTSIHERKKRKECTTEIFQFFRSEIGRKRIQKRSRMYPARKCDRSAEL